MLPALTRQDIQLYTLEKNDFTTGRVLKSFSGRGKRTKIGLHFLSPRRTSRDANPQTAHDCLPVDPHFQTFRAARPHINKCRNESNMTVAFYCHDCIAELQHQFFVVVGFSAPRDVVHFLTRSMLSLTTPTSRSTHRKYVVKENMAPSSASNKTPSHDEDPIRKQLKILSPLPHVPWDHPPPLATGAGKGNSPASSRHRHGNQAGNDRSSDGVYRRTRARSQKRISFGDGSSFSSHQQQQEEEEEDRVRQKVGKQQRRTGMPAYMYLSRYDAPSYLVGNPYIHGGYRACRTLRESCQGLFYYHNSWLDTWTSCFSWIHAHVLLAVAVWRYGAFDQDWLSAFVFGLFYVHVAWVHAPASIVCHLVRRREGGREGAR